MASEIWLALGAGVFLLVAGMAQGLDLFKSGPHRRRWGLVALVAELGAVVALAVALVMAALAHREWSPTDLRQVSLGLALATLAVHVGMVIWLRLPEGRSRFGMAGLLVDLIALGLILFGTLTIRPGGPPLLCAQRALPFYLQWILYWLGAGAVVASGSAGLALVLHQELERRRPDLGLPHRSHLCVLLAESTSLALVILGGGLVVGLWWAWRTVGGVTSGDPREGWMAVTWLAAAASFLAWRLEGQSWRWSAGLSMLAAVAVILGLLAVSDLVRLLAM